MTKALFDRPEMFAAYSEYRRQPGCKNDRFEQPAVWAALPDPKGKRILDIGCGTGSFARQALSRGADLVVGVDPSVRMTGEALARLPERGFEIATMAIEGFQWGGRPFDIIVSSLAFHYVEPLPEVLRRCGEWMVSGGTFIMTVSHPAVTSRMDAPEPRSAREEKCFLREEGLRRHFWLVDDVVKYHRRGESYVEALNDAGFTLRFMTSLGESEESRDEPSQTPAYKPGLPDFALFCAQAS